MISKSLLIQQPPVTPVFEAHYYPSERLVWRQRKLIVQLALADQPVVLPPVVHPAWLTDCLKRSPVKLVALDLNLGAQRLAAWADACQQAEKRAFLRLPASPGRAAAIPAWRGQLARSLECLAAAILLLLLSPIMALVALLIRIESSGPILCGQWCIGKRGQLFRLMQFRTEIVAPQSSAQLSAQRRCYADQRPFPSEPSSTRLGRWLKQGGWEQLPQLLHVLRGEMSFFGRFPDSLESAAQMTPEFRRRLNTCPGMTGSWRYR